MSILYLALPVALALGGAALIACVVCIARGQYDDLETPAVRMLIDDQPQPLPPHSQQSATKTESVSDDSEK